MKHIKQSIWYKEWLAEQRRRKLKCAKFIFHCCVKFYRYYDIIETQFSFYKL